MTQIVDLRREVKTRQRTGVAVTAVVALVLVAGAFAVGTRFVGSDESAPPAAPSVSDEARQVAAGFLQAYGSYDADRALGYLTDQALSPQWLSPEGLRDELAWNEAVGWTELRSPCERVDVQGATVDLRCAYTVHALGSEQLGRGPYGGSHWDLQVRDGKIVSARAEFPFESNGFSVEMWEPFVDFVDTTYPRDGDVMYTDGTRSDAQSTPESLRLWEQHIRDYVEARTAEG